jgi:hypothetical protein
MDTTNAMMISRSDVISPLFLPHVPHSVVVRDSKLKTAAIKRSEAERIKGTNSFFVIMEEK